MGRSKNIYVQCGEFENSPICMPSSPYTPLVARIFFSPTVRLYCIGDGVYQQGVNYCVDLLNEGKWIHVFPEGELCTFFNGLLILIFLHR